MSNAALPDDHDIVHALREKAEDGYSVADLIRALIDLADLKPDDDGRYPSFLMHRYFVAAFGVSLRSTFDVALWHGFVSGTYSDEEVERLFGPTLRASLNAGER